MLLRVPFAAALAACLVAPVLADDKKNEADLKALVSKWSIEKAELGGKDITDVLKVLKFEIRANGAYTAQHDDQKDEGAFTVDTSKTPKEMDIKGTGGPNKGKTIKAIYKLDGDALVICYAFDAGDRPTKFESKDGTQHLLTTYKRVK